MQSLQNLQSIKAMSLNEYEKYIDEFASSNENTIARLTEYENDAGHAFYKHGTHKEGVLAKEAIKSGKPRSSFKHDEDIDVYLSHIVTYNAKNIANWLFLSNDSYLDITMNYGEDVGIAFAPRNGHLKKYASQGLTVCLGRSYAKDTQTGFYLRTMYPSIKFAEFRTEIDDLGPTKEIRFKDIENEEILGKPYYIESLTERQNRMLEELANFDWGPENHEDIEDILDDEDCL